MDRPQVQKPLVAVPTYQRPDGLSTFLSSVLPQIREGAHLLVVDNDPDGSAKKTVELAVSKIKCSEDRVTYILEPEPGIAKVRNSALSWIIDSEYDALVFVDDDEFASASWLDHLLQHMNSSQTDIVSGPIISILPHNTPSWIRQSEFFQRPRRATGSTNWTAASNNTILRRSMWEDAGQPFFDAAFSRTGGSDTDFFSRLEELGARISYTEAAVVYEKIPQTRLNHRWLAKRAYRSGIVNGLVMRRRRSRPFLAVIGAATTVAGATGALGNATLGKHPKARHWNRALYGIGLIAAQFGHKVYEYQRG